MGKRTVAPRSWCEKHQQGFSQLSSCTGCRTERLAEEERQRTASTASPSHCRVKYTQWGGVEVMVHHLHENLGEKEIARFLAEGWLTILAKDCKLPEPRWLDSDSPSERHNKSPITF